MSAMGRVMGHGMGAFFLALGIGFLWLGLSEAATTWLDTNSACQYGDCSSAVSGAKTTFIILGASFIGTAVVSSAVTEFAVRKTRRIMADISGGIASGDPAESVASFLKPFGIELDPATNANVNVQRRVIDLRGQRRGGEVPTDPAGLSEYLKSMGINIDEDILRNATVMKDDEVLQQGAPLVTTRAEEPGTRPAAAPDANLVRERATIVRKRDRGATAANQRLLELELEVQPVGRAPYRVEVPTLVRSSLASLLIEGSALNVRVDPNEASAVTIDWAEN